MSIRGFFCNTFGKLYNAEIRKGHYTNEKQNPYKAFDENMRLVHFLQYTLIFQMHYSNHFSEMISTYLK